MSGYRISEAAEMSGFAPSALRFYEGAGVLPEPARTPAGYRQYDDAAVERLRFVNRARQLGLPMEEIRDLVEVWDAGVCATAQQDFAQRIAARRRRVQAGIEELQSMHTRLLAVERTVTNVPSDGACGPGCACMATTDADVVAPASAAGPAPSARGPVELALLLSHPDVPNTDTAALACTLGASDVPDRLEAWRDLLTLATGRDVTATGERLHFEAAPALAARIGELCALEQQCCSFFTFTVQLAASGISLEVSAPDGASDLVTALLSSPS